MVTYLLNIPVTVQNLYGVRISGMLNDFGLYSCEFFVCFYNFAHKEEIAYPSFS